MKKHGPLNVQMIIEPSFGENGFLIRRDGRPDCWIIDPGLPPQAPRQFAVAIEQHKLAPRAILVTHGHADHIGGIPTLRELLGDVPVYCPRGEETLLVDPNENLSAPFGFPIAFDAPDRILDPGETLTLAELDFKVLDVAGHSPGGGAYYCAAAGVVFVGDALFADSIGRYDFPHSSPEKLMANIKNHLLTLPNETIVYSGHGPAATIAEIREHNEVLRMELKRWLR